MFKNIFRSRKKSKSGLTTSSDNGATPQPSLSFYKPRGAMTAVQLNNVAGHSERAIDVPFENQVQISLCASSSVDNVSTATAVPPVSVRGINDLHLKRKDELTNKILDKENVTIDGKNAFRQGYVKQRMVASPDNLICNLPNVSQQPKSQKTQPGVCHGMPTTRECSRSLDVLLVDDSDNCKLQRDFKFPGQTASVSTPGDSSGDDSTQKILKSLELGSDCVSLNKHCTVENRQQSVASSYAATDSTSCKSHNSFPASDVMQNPEAWSKIEETALPSDADELIIPQLVPLHENDVCIQLDPSITVSKTAGVSSADCGNQRTVLGGTFSMANESAMYILTDSFLDYSSASFMHANNKSCAHDVRSDFDVMVVDDYTPQTVAACKRQLLPGSDVDYEPESHNESSLCTVIKKPDVFFSIGDNSNQGCKLVHQSDEQKPGQQKPIRDWTANEVLLWVQQVGLERFYDVFKKNGIVGLDISVISTKLLDRLGIFGQAEREQVLNRLYLLHAPCVTSQPCFGSACVTGDRSLSPVSQAGCVDVVTSSSVPSRESDNSSHSRVVKHLDFDEMSLTSSQSIRLPVNIERNSVRSHCLSDERASTDKISHSSGHLRRSVATNTDETHHTNLKSQLAETLTSGPDYSQDLSVEQLKSENADLLARLASMKESLLAKELLIETLQKEKSDLEGQLSMSTTDVEGRCIHDILSLNSSNAVGSVVAVDLNRTETRSFGFMLGLDSSQQPIIKHVEPNIPLKKGDRILEVNARHVTHLSESLLYKQLNGITGSAKMVVLRLPDPKQGHCSDDLESLKEDLALALMELETVQQENKDLTREVDRLKRLAAEDSDLCASDTEMDQTDD